MLASESADVSNGRYACQEDALEDVDEGLFLEDIDEDSDSSQMGVVNGEEEGGIAVDESLFDVDNLQDLNLDDPAILEPPGES